MVRPQGLCLPPYCESRNLEIVQNLKVLQLFLLFLLLFGEGGRREEGRGAGGKVGALRRHSREKGGFQGQNLAPLRLWKGGRAAWSTGDYISREHLRPTEGRDHTLVAVGKTQHSDWRSQRRLGAGRASPRGPRKAWRVC